MSNTQLQMTNEIPNSPVGESARQLAHFQPAGVIPMLKKYAANQLNLFGYWALGFDWIFDIGHRELGFYKKMIVR